MDDDQEEQMPFESMMEGGGGYTLEGPDEYDPDPWAQASGESQGWAAQDDTHGHDDNFGGYEYGYGSGDATEPLAYESEYVGLGDGFEHGPEHGLEHGLEDSNEAAGGANEEGLGDAAEFDGVTEGSDHADEAARFKQV